MDKFKSKIGRGSHATRPLSAGPTSSIPPAGSAPGPRLLSSCCLHLEQDRSRHAVCKLTTALRLVAGKDVRVWTRAFPEFSPSRFARGLQMLYSALQLPYSIVPGRTIISISGRALAYTSDEVEYFRDKVARRAIRSLSMKRPFFVISGDPTASLSSQIGCDRTPAPKLRFASKCVVIVGASYRGIPAVFRVGRCEAARAEVSRQINGIKLAASIPSLQKVVPKLLAHSSGESVLDVSVESLLPGSHVEFRWKLIDAILELWLASGRQPSGSPARPLLEQELSQVCQSFPAYQSSLSRFKDTLLKWHSTLMMPGSVAHGDLWLGNILFSGDSVSGIIDWDWAHRDGLRLVDALRLLFMSYSVFRNVSAAELLRSFWSDGLEDRELSIRLDGLSHSFGLCTNDLKFASLLLWFDYLQQRIVRGRMSGGGFSEDMIPRTIPVITRWLNENTRMPSEAAA